MLLQLQKSVRSMLSTGCLTAADERAASAATHIFLSSGFFRQMAATASTATCCCHDAALLQVQLHFFGQHPTDAAEMFRYFRSIGATISLSDDFIPGKTKQMTTKTTTTMATTMTTTADVHVRNIEPLFGIVASL